MTVVRIATLAVVAAILTYDLVEGRAPVVAAAGLAATAILAVFTYRLARR